MRPWVIIVVSALAALAAAIALSRPELVSTPHGAVLPSLLPLLPTLAAAALAVYGVCAILLVAGSLIAEALRLRWHLDRNPPDHGPARPAWTAMFEASGLRRLIPPPAAVQPRPASADGTVIVQGRFDPREARREVARLCYIGAARTHFFTALIVLAAGVVLGAARQHGPLPIMPGPIPTVPAALAVAGLVLLAILARIAVDVAAEPLIAKIAQLPAEPVEAGLLRRTAALLENATAPGPPRDGAAGPALQIPDRLVTVLEQGHRALLDAVERLSVTTQGLGTTTNSSIEALEAAVRTAGLHQQSMPQSAAVDTAAMTDLRDAVVALTALLGRVRQIPDETPDGAPAGADDSVNGEPAPAPPNREPDLARELRKLLQEIETAP